MWKFLQRLKSLVSFPLKIMRTAGAVYRKLKEAKFRHLVALYQRYLNRTPDNCRYNHAYKFKDLDGVVHEMRLCMLHQNSEDISAGIVPHLVDVCQADGDCRNCNAFIPRFSKEDIRKIFENELDTKKVKEKKYPDICALEWVLERSSVGLPPLTWIQSVYYSIKRYLLGNKII